MSDIVERLAAEFAPEHDGQIVLSTTVDADLLRDAVTAIRERDAEIERLQAVIKNAARDLYRAEVHRQGVGWDDFCTDLLVRSQHALAAETIRK